MTEHAGKPSTKAVSKEAGAPGERVERLARVLHWKMEHLEPTDRPDWVTLTEREKDLYRLCIEAILMEL